MCPDHISYASLFLVSFQFFRQIVSIVASFLPNSDVFHWLVKGSKCAAACNEAHRISIRKQSTKGLKEAFVN